MCWLCNVDVLSWCYDEMLGFFVFMCIVFIIGIFGLGKFVVLNVFEDVGYYCVDNLLLYVFFEFVCYFVQDGQCWFVVVIDVCLSVLFDEMFGLICELFCEYDVCVLFFNVSIQVLIQCFFEMCCCYLLFGLLLYDVDVGLLLLFEEVIECECEFVVLFVEFGYQIDISMLCVNVLCIWVKCFIEQKNNDLMVMFELFGFKCGVLFDVDLMFDVCVLLNLYYDYQLCLFIGFDQLVIVFFDVLLIVYQMIDDIYVFLMKWLLYFCDDNCSYLIVVIGCMGGQYCFVFIVEMFVVCLVCEVNVIVWYCDVLVDVDVLLWFVFEVD